MQMYVLGSREKVEARKGLLIETRFAISIGEKGTVPEWVLEVILQLQTLSTLDLSNVVKNRKRTTMTELWSISMYNDSPQPVQKIVATEH